MRHQHAAGAGAEQADGAGHVRQVVGNRRLAQERLGHSGGQALGDRFQLPVRAQGPGTGEDRHAPAAIEDRRGGLQVGVARVGSRLDEAHRRHHVAVLVGLALRGRHLLHVVGHDHRRHLPLADRHAQGSVQHMEQLCRADHGLDIGGNVLEQALQIDFLLVVAAQRGSRLLADDGQHRLMIHARVVEPVQQVDRARPRGGEAHPDLSGELGVGAGHEGRHLLVAHADIVECLGAPAHGAHDPVDAIAGVAEDALHPPLAQAFEQLIGNRAGHSRLLVVSGVVPVRTGAAGEGSRQSSGGADGEID